MLLEDEEPHVIHHKSGRWLRSIARVVHRAEEIEDEADVVGQSVAWSYDYDDGEASGKSMYPRTPAGWERG
ncbi:hypothetical protein CMQ_1245 [Grosmannia clavigera kw1407]|uniref:Uncharacterized protein n=1 Tax=Grosmannia clavigera (strain kw1407 / UAMH 11150) TaxID=655863 RepID=F0XDY6_GROCL|nr:uncharacterized protein CMQ_1245 [Grosmannia clavigera kw1407]EFX04317.1 hypothetical protein CMQ_1245 [Grosmannia clavigera kw1407]